MLYWPFYAVISQLHGYLRNNSLIKCVNIFFNSKFEENVIAHKNAELIFKK